MARSRSRSYADPHSPHSTFHFATTTPGPLPPARDPLPEDAICARPPGGRRAPKRRRPGAAGLASIELDDDDRGRAAGRADRDSPAVSRRGYNCSTRAAPPVHRPRVRGRGMSRCSEPVAHYATASPGKRAAHAFAAATHRRRGRCEHGPPGRGPSRAAALDEIIGATGCRRSNLRRRRFFFTKAIDYGGPHVLYYIIDM